MKGKSVCIIGGGAAGLMAATAAASRGLCVTVVEQNERPGKKILITGKGRCNVTNNCSREELLGHIRRGERFLRSAFSAFSNEDTMHFFESRGVPLKTERGNRVFPQSDRAADIADALAAAAREAGAVFHRGRARKLILQEGAVKGIVLSHGEQISCDAVIIATGGLSYPKTGSDGSGYLLAKQAGHMVTPLGPSLIPVVAQESYCEAMQGLSLKNVVLRLFRAGKTTPVFEELGEMLFTHFGISGPLVLSASSFLEADRLSEYRFFIDWKPGLSPEKLEARLLREWKENGNQSLKNLLKNLLPAKAIGVFLDQIGVDGTQKGNQIPREIRRKLLALLKNFPVTPRALRPIEEAIVTAGGVDLREVNPKTMASKLVGGLAFAGEILDADAYTGGFNLQIAFSTGFAAGHHILEE